MSEKRSESSNSYTSRPPAYPRNCEESRIRDRSPHYRREETRYTDYERENERREFRSGSDSRYSNEVIYEDRHQSKYRDEYREDDRDAKYYRDEGRRSNDREVGYTERRQREYNEVHKQDRDRRDTRYEEFNPPERSNDNHSDRYHNSNNNIKNNIYQDKLAKEFENDKVRNIKQFHPQTPIQTSTLRISTPIIQTKNSVSLFDYVKKEEDELAVYQSERENQDQINYLLSLDASLRKSQFDYEMAIWEVQKWENQIQAIERKKDE